MRLERMTAVVVLATGLWAGGVVSAAPQETEPPAAKPPAAKPPAAKTSDATNPSGLIPTGVRSPAAPVAPKPRPLGDQHKILDAFVGHWKSKVPPSQAGPTITVKAEELTADGKLVMGGRFAQVSQQGVRDGQPFEGMMLVGFDEVVNRYTAMWVDTSSNAIIHSVGTFDAAKKQLTMTAHFSAPATRRLTIEKRVITFVDASHWTYEEYVAHAVGEKETRTKSLTFNKD